MNEVVIRAKKLYTPLGINPKRGREMANLFVKEDVYIHIVNDRIVDISHSRPDFNGIYLYGDLVIPGLIDCHTHIPFYGYRESDFLRRSSGLSYLQIHNSGGGIYESVSKLRSASFDDLVRFNLKLINRLFRKGVTTLEGKTGYGLDTENELKQLKVLEVLNKLSPAEIIPTFMGAHSVPKEKDQDSYVNDLISMLDLIKNRCTFVDIFCDEGAFDIDHASKYLMAAKERGYKVRVHADEIKNTQATKLAVKLGAISAEHLIKIDEDSIKSISQSNTIAVLLPATSFYINESYAPARKLIDSNAIVSLASDFNPGSSAVIEPSFVMNISVKNLKMTPQEILTAFTLNAACVLSLSDRLGSVEIGKQADLLIYNDADLETITYLIGIQPDYVIKRGEIFEN